MSEGELTECYDIGDWPSPSTRKRKRVHDWERLGDLMARSKAAAEKEAREEEEERRRPPDVPPKPTRRSSVIYSDVPECWTSVDRRDFEEGLVRFWEDRACGLYVNSEWSAEDNALARRWAQQDLGWSVTETPVSIADEPVRFRASSPKPEILPGELVYVTLAKGEKVPDWIEESPYPGVFEVDVRCIIGLPSIVEERYPGLFHVDPPFHPDARSYPKEEEPMIHMAPVEPLAPGQCLIRYLGAAFSKTKEKKFRGVTHLPGVRSGGPHAVVWLEDGDDALQYAYPLQPLFRPQSSKPEIGPDGVAAAYLSKGERVPDWIELSSYPGVFDVDVICLIGLPRMILKRHPGLFPASHTHDYKGDEILAAVLYLAPAHPLAPGECLIRYLGAAIDWRSRVSFSKRGRMTEFWWDGPGVIERLNEGNDELRYAHPERPPIAAAPKVAREVRSLRLSKGEAVPDWIETRSQPGVFGVDVFCHVGTPRALLDLHPGLFHFDRPNKRFDSQRDDGDPMVYMAPAEPLAPGQCLIRYPGASFSKGGTLNFQSRPRCRIVCSGGPDALVWLEEGDDALHYTVPFRPRFRPQAPKPADRPGEVQYLEFLKGEKVPDWVEVTSYPGVFEVDVCCVIGPPRTILERHPGLFRHFCEYSSDDFAEPILYMAPVEPLAPGQCLIRYLGAAIARNGYPAFRREKLWDEIRDTGPAVCRLDDGWDVLFYVDPIEQP